MLMQGFMGISKRRISPEGKMEEKKPYNQSYRQKIFRTLRKVKPLMQTEK
jgi:hypothetical protein